MTESPELNTQQEQAKSQETPTLQSTEQPSPEAEVRTMLEQLEKMGVRKPEELQGMAVASQQAGNLANMLGEIRKENAQLRAMLQDVATKAKAPAKGEFDYSSEPVDLKALVRDAVGEFYDQKFIKPQQEAQARFAEQVQEVMQDELYPVIGKEFEEYMKSPQVQYRVTAGQASLDREWNKFKDTYWKNLAMGMATNLKKYLGSGAKPASSEAPHVESSGAHQFVPPETRPDVKAKLVKLAETEPGGDDRLAKMIALLVGGEPSR